MRLAIENLECERQCRIFGAGEVHHVGKDRTLPPFKLRCSERSTCSHTTAQDAAKAAIAFLKNLDDIREISVEQVTPSDKDRAAGSGGGDSNLKRFTKRFVIVDDVNDTW